MHEDEVRGERAVYDHETEDPAGARRRRRAAADWGVGEELFEHMPSPRRRFTPAEPPRRESHPRERREVMIRDEVAPAPRREVARVDAPRRREDAPPAPAQAGRELAVTAPRGGVEGRRTVVIGRQSTSPGVRRDRPSRTVGERVGGHRPDRLAGYAVALGMLLIVIAFLSS
jgi:hypothetical protein